MVMSSEIEKILRSTFFSCPFGYCCILEKKEFLCKFPECKEYTEYNELFRRSKGKQLF